MENNDPNTTQIKMMKTYIVEFFTPSDDGVIYWNLPVEYYTFHTRKSLTEIRKITGELKSQISDEYPNGLTVKVRVSDI